MSITINGTTGIAGVDGTASAPAVQGADSNTGVFFPAADTVAVTTGGSERLRIDSSGNVGIGTSSPASKFDVNGTIRISAPSSLNYNLDIYSNGQTTNNVSLSQGLGGPTDNIGFLWNRANAAFSFGTNNAERMRIDASGKVSIATTAVAAELTVNGHIAAVSGYLCHAGASAGLSFGNVFNFFWSGSSLQAWIDSTNIGNVTVTSDYRIKRNIETQTAEALSRVMQLRPVTYQMADYGTMFKASDDIKEGFIAHELAAVIPSAVDGEKDAPDQIQSLRIDALVAVLTKAIQEQQAIITALTARIAALEAK